MKLDVILPVGPGHEELYKRAIMSVSMAMCSSMGPFKEVNIRAIDDMKGSLGRSMARNTGVAESKADWLFFLDSDDLMHPDCLENFIGCEHLDAVWGLTTELVQDQILTRWQVHKISTYKDLIKFDPFFTVKMGHFVHRDVAIKYPFNTEMDCGEDWEYYLRVWKNQVCEKVNRPFFVKVKGTHSTGPRSATGREWNVAVDKLIKEARECV